MSRLSLFLLTLSFVAFISCDLWNTDGDSTGVYSYTAYDSLGVLIVTGWFTMEYQDSVNITGEWEFKKVGNPRDIGPQVGGGELVGRQDTTTVVIDLNPQYRDNNVILFGEVEGNAYTGEWIWSTFIGETNKGTFAAFKD